MAKYFYFWIFFIVISAIWHGHKVYRENKAIGYNIVWFQKTGQKILFQDGFWKMIGNTFVAALSLILSPFFLVIESLKFIPAAFVLYLINL